MWCGKRGKVSRLGFAVTLNPGDSRRLLIHEARSVSVEINMTDSVEGGIWVRTSFEEFKPLEGEAGKDVELSKLHALERIAEAVCFLAKEKFEEKYGSK